MSNNNIETTYSSMDEIVFQNRNKKYGAYDLRSRYPSILTKSFIIGSLAFLLAVGAPFVYMKIKAMNDSEINLKAQTVEILEDEEIIEEIEELPPPPPPKDEPKIEIVQNIVPDPVKAPKIETPPPPVEVTKNTTVGTINQEGEKKVDYAPPPPVSTGKAVAVAVKPQVDDKQVYSEVEQLAEFPGGINSFRNKVQNEFDASVMEEDEGTMKAEVSFVVEKDGQISDVKATGANKDFNKEAERTVRSIKNKWAPAKINGQSVRYRFRMPLAMQF